MNAKIMIVAVAVVAAIILAGAGIAEGKPSRGIARVPPKPIRPMLVEISDLLATPHAPTVDDVQLEWSEVAGATHYNVYRSLSIRGDGFNFSTPYAVIPGNGAGKIVWADAGAYADNNSYAWVVRPVDGNGEHNYTTNIAWKLCYDLFIGAGSVNPDLNYISLPYRMNVTSGTNVNNAAALLGDMKAYGTPSNSVTSVARWNQDNSVWESRLSLFGKNFPLAPGEAYRIGIKQNFTYKIVGAYDSNIIHNLRIGLGTVAMDLNYISIPYHYNIVWGTNANDAAALRGDMRDNGSPTNSVNSVQKWNSDTGMWYIRTIVGTNFALKPGECYRVIPTTISVQWHCPVTVLGA